MKKYSIYTILTVAFLALVSCEDFLDKNPESDLTADLIYNDYDRFKGVIDRACGLIHNSVYSAFDYGNEIGTYSDEAQQASNRWGYGVHVMDQVNSGNWLNSSCPGFAWRMTPGGTGVGDTGQGSNAEFHYRKWRVEVHGEAVVGIRAVNTAIANISALEKFPDESIYTADQLKAQLLGQAYFLRGWFYFMIIRDYGGMTNMQDAFPTDFDFDLARPEYWESSEWAVQDLDSAIKYLPEDWALPADQGRVTQTTAKAVKSMVLLYQASPNMNIPRDESLGFSGTPEYNLTTLERAVAANVEALESALDPATRYRLYDETEYMDAFYVKQSSLKYISDEAIFQAPHGTEAFSTFGNVGKETGTGFYLPWFDGSYDWCGYAVPTQNAVDFYETADGWNVDDAVANGAAWDPQDPYTNRDPRLKRFIFCHGDKMYLTNDEAPKLTGLGLDLYLNATEGQGHHAAENNFGSNSRDITMLVNSVGQETMPLMQNLITMVLFRFGHISGLHNYILIWQKQQMSYTALQVPSQVLQVLMLDLHLKQLTRSVRGSGCLMFKLCIMPAKRNSGTIYGLKEQENCIQNNIAGRI